MIYNCYKIKNLIKINIFKNKIKNKINKINMIYKINKINKINKI